MMMVEHLKVWKKFFRPKKEDFKVEMKTPEVPGLNL